MPSRRQFLEAMTGSAAALVAGDRLATLAGALEARARGRDPAALAGDEDYWAEVGRGYTVDRSLVNLNNGGVSPAPRVVQDAMKRHLDFSHGAPTLNMWRVLEPRREAVRQRLALQCGCQPDEIAVTRNASESLQTCQLGMDLTRGDVVLTTEHDYPRMIQTFQQRARREGIELRQFALPMPADDPAEVVSLFAENIDRHRPKVVLMSHVTFTTGTVLPVAEVVAAARQRGVPVIVDGAHAFAHVPFKLTDLDCDYYAASLHKWLCAPHGTGILYVRKSLIGGLWPLMAADEKLDDDIRKFEEIGTHPAANHLAIAEALSFHQAIGAERKATRLAYLREYWARRVVDPHADRVAMLTSRKPGASYAIGTFAIEGIEPGPLHSWLLREHRIITSPMSFPHCSGLRVSPSVYTTLEELDRFCAAIEWVLAHGLPESRKTK